MGEGRQKVTMISSKHTVKTILMLIPNKNEKNFQTTFTVESMGFPGDRPNCPYASLGVCDLICSLRRQECLCQAGWVAAVPSVLGTDSESPCSLSSPQSHTHTPWPTIYRVTQGQHDEAQHTKPQHEAPQYEVNYQDVTHLLYFITKRKSLIIIV